MSGIGLLVVQVMAKGLPKPELEYRFHKTRRWRFDVAWPEGKVGVEVDGGTWVGGRHVRGKGFERDCEKVNAAVELGWKVYRFVPSMIESGMAIKQIERVLRHG